jgi:hypothetical protein
LKARLDGFAITLQNEPESKGFVIVYRSSRDLPGLSGRLSNVVKSHLVNSRGIEPQRIIAVDGGVSSCLKYELWVAPKGTAPKVKESYLNSDFDNNVPTKFDSKPFYWMFEDDSDPTHLSDALEGFADALRKHKNFKAYIIVYGQHYLQEIDNSKYDANGNVIKKRVYKKLYQDSQAEIWKSLRAMKRGLITNYGVSPARIKLVNGEYRQFREAGLWLVPRGAHAPIATPNQFPKRHRKR